MSAIVAAHRMRGGLCPMCGYPRPRHDVHGGPGCRLTGEELAVLFARFATQQDTYATVTVVVRVGGQGQADPLEEVLDERGDVMWFGTEPGVSTGALAGGAEPDEWMWA